MYIHTYIHTYLYILIFNRIYLYLTRTITTTAVDMTNVLETDLMFNPNTTHIQTKTISCYKNQHLRLTKLFVPLQIIAYNYVQIVIIHTYTHTHTHPPTYTIDIESEFRQITLFMQLGNQKTYMQETMYILTHCIY